MTRWQQHSVDLKFVNNKTFQIANHVNSIEKNLEPNFIPPNRPTHLNARLPAVKQLQTHHNVHQQLLKPTLLQVVTQYASHTVELTASSALPIPIASSSKTPYVLVIVSLKTLTSNFLSQNYKYVILIVVQQQLLIILSQKLKPFP